MTDLRNAIESARSARCKALAGPEKEPEMKQSMLGIASLSDALGLAPEARRGTATTTRLAYAALFLAIGVVMLVLAIPGAMQIPLSGCRNDPGRLVFGETFEVEMNLSRNTACPVLLRPGSASVDKLEITTLPRHGALAPRGRTGVIYRADRNYKGEDFFAFAMRGQSAAYNGTSVVRVHVQVR
jgi:hypothetical protein